MVSLSRTRTPQVHASEVEAFLRTLPGVRDAAVVGIPDERLGQLVGAVIVRTHEEAVTAVTRSAAETCAQVDKRCRANLSAFKVPRRIAVWPATDLPTNSSGKVDKPALREFLMGSSVLKPGGEKLDDAQFVRSRL